MSSKSSYTYTAYLPDTVRYVRAAGRDESSSGLSHQLDDYSHRLDRQSQKLANLNYTCEANLAKCKRVFEEAQKRESRLKDSLTETKRSIRSKSSTIEPFKSSKKSSVTPRSKYSGPGSSRFLGKSDCGSSSYSSYSSGSNYNKYH